MKNHLKVEYRPIESVTPYCRNARTHSKEQIQQIARSISAFGFINPVLVDQSGTLVAGHARVLAAQQLDLRSIPTILIDHLSEAEKRAYILADNRLAENAKWDEELLRVELEFLSHYEIDFDVELTGFGTTEIDLLLGHELPGSQEEPLPEVPHTDHIATRPGDIWLLGPHRVSCGDCRNPATMQQLMGGQRARMVLTDPPYNVPIAGHASGLGKHQHREFPMASGEMDSHSFIDFLGSAFNQLREASEEGALHYVFMDWRHVEEVQAAGRIVYDDLINLCVWVKNNGGMGSLYRSQHELIFVFKVGTAPHSNNVELGKNGRYRTNVWHYAGVNAFGAERDESLALHPTVKPVQMLADAILDVTRRGDIVLDGFLGSGSTLMAAEQTGRICYGVEIDPGYCDVVVQRWQNNTSNPARRKSDGCTLQEIRAERCAGAGV